MTAFLILCFFFFKQKTAYEMRISDWSSDVCSSDLAFIFDANDGLDDANFAELHKRLWSWGGVPLVYRAVPGCIQLFRCAHEPDFAGQDDVPVCRPIRTLLIGAKIAEQDRSEEHTSELQSLMRISSAVFCLKKKK